MLDELDLVEDEDQITHEVDGRRWKMAMSTKHFRGLSPQHVEDSGNKLSERLQLLTWPKETVPERIRRLLFIL